MLLQFVSHREQGSHVGKLICRASKQFLQTLLTLCLPLPPPPCFFSLCNFEFVLNAHQSEAISSPWTCELPSAMPLTANSQLQHAKKGWGEGESQSLPMFAWKQDGDFCFSAPSYMSPPAIPPANQQFPPLFFCHSRLYSTTEMNCKNFPPGTALIESSQSFAGRKNQWMLSC